MMEEQANNKDVQQNETPTKAIKNNKGLKILFLSSDTGGGHRASAESLASQFLHLYPSSTYTLLDILSDHAPPPYNHSISGYQHLSSNPTQWKVVYTVTNTWPIKDVASLHLKLWSEKGVRQSIRSYNPDVVVSVHPLMTNVPVISCAKISAETNRHIPIFTVVTDLGNGHVYWFDDGVEKMFVGSESMRDLAIRRGGVVEEKIVRSGLPIREEFGAHVDNMKVFGGGNEVNLSEKEMRIGYQLSVRKELGISLPDEENSKEKHRVVMIMGGGEGVGSLSSIVKSLYIHFVKRQAYLRYHNNNNNSSSASNNNTDKAYNLTILVICGRNTKLQNQLSKDVNWDEIKKQTETQIYQEEERKKKTRETIKGIQSFIMDKAKLLPSLSSSGSSNDKDNDEKEDEEENDCDNEDECKHDETIVDGDDENDCNNVATSPSISTANISSTSSQLLTTDETEKTLRKENESTDDDTVSSHEQEERQKINNTNDTSTNTTLPKITVKPLGYTTQIASYMVSSNILITKAGPGTIAEAASLGLPTILTSYLPGQEEGNVDFVLQNNFGAYVCDADCDKVANTVLDWLGDEEMLDNMSREAMRVGKPHAARDIVREIGKSAWRWKELNEHEDEVVEVVEEKGGVKEGSFSPEIFARKRY